MTTFTQERYINPYTDFGFKKLFGTEMNKDLLISFLNALLSDIEKHITDIQYLNSEQLGYSYSERRSVFDVYCTAEDGSRFIVEMQKAPQPYFKDRTLYYSAAAIQKQGQTGEWNYCLNPVYAVSVMNFKFPKGEYTDDNPRHIVQLKDVEDNHVFYDKLTFIYLEMPKFNKTEDELETMYDKWLFVLRNLSRLLERPAALQERIFTKIFEQAEIARYTPEEYSSYEESKKVLWDNYSTLEYAVQKGRAEGLEKGLEQGLERGLEEGRAEGREEEKAATVRRLAAMGLAAEQIAQATALASAQVQELLSVST